MLVGLWRFDASIFFISSKSSDFVVGTYNRSAKCCFVIESKNINSKFVEFFEIEKIVQLAKDDKWFEDISTNFNSWKQSLQSNAPQWSVPHFLFLSGMKEQNTCSVKSFCRLQTKHSLFFHPFFYKREVVCPAKLDISVRHNCFWTSPRRRYQNIPKTIISFENHIFQIQRMLIAWNFQFKDSILNNQKWSIDWVHFYISPSKIGSEHRKFHIIDCVIFIKLIENRLDLIQVRHVTLCIFAVGLTGFMIRW